MEKQVEDVESVKELIKRVVNDISENDIVNFEPFITNDCDKGFISGFHIEILKNGRKYLEE